MGGLGQVDYLHTVNEVYLVRAQVCICFRMCTKNMDGMSLSVILDDAWKLILAS
jgi:hypothetical protein